VAADLAGGITADRASFTASASRGDQALGGLAAGMGIASLLMAAGCARGLARRIAEYR
jgi:L-serine deaminase